MKWPDWSSVRHRNKKNYGQTKNKNRLAQKKRCWQKSVKAVQEEEVKLLSTTKINNGIHTNNNDHQVLK